MEESRMIEQLIECGDRTLVSTSFGGMLILEHTDPKIRRHWLNRGLLILALARVNVGSKVCIRCVIAADGSTISVQQVDINKYVRLAKQRLTELETVDEPGTSTG